MLQLLALVDPTSLTWVFVVSLLLALIMGFATGANDVANTFGTSVGSGALTLRKALIAAGIFEMAGALALGAHVAGTLKSGIAKWECFELEPNLYMIGMTSALGAAALWLLVASLLGLPVSATHSIVGGIVGMAMVLKGPKCVIWGMKGVGKIVLSWVTSPLLAGICAFLVYTLIVRIIYFSSANFNRALWATPFMLASSVTFITILTFWDMAKPWWAKVIITVAVPIVIFVATALFAIPYLRKAISRDYQRGDLDSLGRHAGQKVDDHHSPLVSSNSSSQLLSSESVADYGAHADDPDIASRHSVDGAESARSSSSSASAPADSYQLEKDLKSQEVKLEEQLVDAIGDTGDGISADEKKATQVFWYLQNVSACLGSFAHGANDTANMIGPFAAVFQLWKDGSFNATESVPLWIVALGGLSIVIGLAVLGYRVIQTMGKEIIELDYSSGFSSEFSSSMTVVFASRLEIPVSSTHCQVGAIVGVGLVPSHIKKRAEVAEALNKEANMRIASDGHIQGSSADIEAATSDLEPLLKKSWKDVIKERAAHVQWKSIGKIFSSWLITVPFAAFVSAGLAMALKQIPAPKG